MKNVLIGIVTFVFLSTTAYAQTAPKAQSKDSVAISISPLHLILPMGELQVEAYFGDHFSAALIGGVGKFSLGFGSDTGFMLYEIGGQLRGYFSGTTQEGTFAGVEVIQLWVKGTGDLGGVSALGAGLSIGGIVGHKWVWNNGFFIDLNGGIGYAIVSAEADGEENESATGVLAVVNFNLGYAF